MITVLGKGQFTVDNGETLLAAGLRAGFGLAKACRNGNCDRCAVRLIAGELAIGRQRQRLAAGDPGADMALLCQAYAVDDCTIEDERISAPGEQRVSMLRCQVHQIRALNHNVSAVTLLLPAGRHCSWFAGQYLLLGEQQEAAFSIANAPASGQRELLLHIRHDSDNDSAVALMAELREAATVAVTLPLGDRYIDQPPARPLWFICGSTGFAPARAMIEQLAAHQFRHPVRLFRGGRQAADIYPPEWSPGALAQLADFAEVHAIEQGGDNTAFRGLVHQAALAALEHDPDRAAAEIHLGGSPAMVWAVYDALCANGIAPSQLHSDVFDYAPRD